MIAGVTLSPAPVAVLAWLLQRAGERRLADDVGVAVDADRDELELAANEEATILAVLHNCPVRLKPLRDALRANARRRAEGPT